MKRIKIHYVGVVASNHLAIGDLVAETVSGLVGVDRHVEYISRVANVCQSKSGTTLGLAAFSSSSRRSCSALLGRFLPRWTFFS